jgi:hypothetical protein
MPPSKSNCLILHFCLRQHYNFALGASPSCFHPGMSARSFARAALLDFSASPVPGRHLHACARSSASVPSSNSTTCLPIFGSSLKVWLNFISVTRQGSIRNEAETHPLSPVASTKFFHSGCSHIKSAASAVSVHQHKCLLNNSFSVNFGKNVAIALRMLTSEASG